MPKWLNCDYIGVNADAFSDVSDVMHLHFKWKSRITSIQIIQLKAMFYVWGCWFYWLGEKANIKNKPKVNTTLNCMRQTSHVRSLSQVFHALITNVRILLVQRHIFAFVYHQYVYMYDSMYFKFKTQQVVGLIADYVMLKYPVTFTTT